MNKTRKRPIGTAELRRQAERALSTRKKKAAAPLVRRPTAGVSSTNWKCTRLNWKCRTMNCGGSRRNSKNRAPSTSISMILRRSGI